MRAPIAAAEIDHAAWLAPGLLVVTGWGASGDGDTASVAAAALGGAAPMSAMALDPSDPSRTAFLAVAAVDVRDEPALPPPLRGLLTDTRTLLREALAHRDPPTRARVLEFMSALAVSVAGHRPSALSDSLCLFRDALRERRAPSVSVRDRARAASVDSLLAVGDGTYFVAGWVHDAGGAPARLLIDSPEGMRVEVGARAWYQDDPDVAARFEPSREGEHPTDAAFICHVEMAGAGRQVDGWILEMVDATGAAVEVSAPRVVHDRLAVRRRILATLGRERLPADDLRRHHVHPAVSSIQAWLAGRSEVTDVCQYGKPPVDPAVSVVITLYRRLDLVEQQMAQFALDAEFREVDLIFVLDSPGSSDELRERARGLHRLYDIPFRTVTLRHNLGFSGANNAGASLARAPLLLLLNSDVFPDRPGWLGTMATFHRDTPGIGALGPKLLYEDDTLQHAGMYFWRPDGEELWSNEHFFKGFDRHLPPAGVTRQVPAVTGACMLVDTAVYRDLGGLPTCYVRADFEDSDFCLRLIEEGLTNWYLPAAELYHLEAQSYANDERRDAFPYNRWLHTHLWNDRIESVMASYAQADR